MRFSESWAFAVTYIWLLFGEIKGLNINSPNIVKLSGFQFVRMRCPYTGGQGAGGGSKYLWPGQHAIIFLPPIYSAFFPRIDNQQIPTAPVTLVSQRRGGSECDKKMRTTVKHELARDMA